MSLHETTDADTTILRELPVGGRIWFDGERNGYEVQARSHRYIVCTKPFPLRKTVLYTVIDAVERVRGTENLIFGAGAESREDCEEMVARLDGNDSDLGFATEVSHRNRVPLHIKRARYVSGLWPKEQP